MADPSIDRLCSSRVPVGKVRGPKIFDQLDAQALQRLWDRHERHWGRRALSVRRRGRRGGYRFIQDGSSQRNPPDATPCNNNDIWIQSGDELYKCSSSPAELVRGDAGLAEGQRVTAGTFLGFEGDVGCADGDTWISRSSTRSTSPIRSTARASSRARSGTSAHPAYLRGRRPDPRGWPGLHGGRLRRAPYDTRRGWPGGCGELPSTSSVPGRCRGRGAGSAATSSSSSGESARMARSPVAGTRSPGRRPDRDREPGPTCGNGSCATATENSAWISWRVDESGRSIAARPLPSEPSRVAVASDRQGQAS